MKAAARPPQRITTVEQPIVPLAQFIIGYPDAIPARLCAEIIARFERDPRKISSRTAFSTTPSGRSGSMLTAGILSDWQPLIAPVADAIWKYAGLYAQVYPSVKRLLAKEHSELSPPLLEQIEPGQAYGYHIDAGPGDTYDRFLSALLYLKSVDEGGFTEFPFQRVRIQPRAGLLVLFPPFWTHPHRGTTPISGTKFNITSYFVHRTPLRHGAFRGSRGLQAPDRPLDNE